MERGSFVLFFHLYYFSYFLRYSLKEVILVMYIFGRESNFLVAYAECLLIDLVGKNCVSQ